MPAVAAVVGAVLGTVGALPEVWAFRPQVLVILLVGTLLVACVAWWRRCVRLTSVAVVIGFGLAGMAVATDATDRAIHTPLRAVLDAEFGGFTLESWDPPGRHDPAPVRAVLRVDAGPPVEPGAPVTVRADVVEIRMRGGWVPASGGVNVTVGGVVPAERLREWVAGRTIEVPMAFRRAARYANDGVPDFERELAIRGVTLLASVKSSLLVEVTSRGGPVDEAAARIRAFTRRAVETWVAPRPAATDAPSDAATDAPSDAVADAPSDAVAAGIVAAVLIGDRAGIPDLVRDRLQAAGTYHVIAISGGNIALFVVLIAGVPLLAGASARVAAWPAMALLIAYSQVVTAGPSVWRATLMALLHLAAIGLDHRAPSVHVVTVAATVLVLLRPLDVRDAGFLLTFGATVALLIAARMASSSWLSAHATAARSASGFRLSTHANASRSSGSAGQSPEPEAESRRDRGSPARVRRWRGVAHWLARWVAAAVLATCAVDIVLLPVTAQAFGRVTVAGIVLNLLALPLMALVQVSGMCVVALDALGLPAGWPGSVARSAASALVDSARLVEWIPWSARLVPPPGATLIGVYYAACALAVWGRGRLRAVGIVVLVVSVLAVWVGIPLDAGSWRNAAARVAGLTAPQRSLDWLEPPLRLTMFDVGQAESVLVQPPGGGAMLVDTGGSPFGGERFDIGRLVLAPALRARGVYALDALLVTHGDPDHIGGARSMLDRLGVGQVLLGILVPGHEPSRALVAHARERNVAVRDWRAGQTIGQGGVRVRVLHPPEPDWERRRIRNDDSVVVEIVHGDVAVLLTGDVSSEVERAILPQLSAARTRVLKVAHHGSRTSTSSVILEGWRPQTALISCGRGNLFGHPAPEVLARLARIGARVYRTDRDGEITLESDGREVRVRTALSGPT